MDEFFDNIFTILLVIWVVSSWFRKMKKGLGGEDNAPEVPSSGEYDGYADAAEPWAEARENDWAEPRLENQYPQQYEFRPQHGPESRVEPRAETIGAQIEEFLKRLESAANEEFPPPLPTEAPPKPPPIPKPIVEAETGEIAALAIKENAQPEMHAKPPAPTRDRLIFDLETIRDSMILRSALASRR